MPRHAGTKVASAVVMRPITKTVRNFLSQLFKGEHQTTMNETDSTRQPHETTDPMVPSITDFRALPAIASLGELEDRLLQTFIDEKAPVLNATPSMAATTVASVPKYETPLKLEDHPPEAFLIRDGDPDEVELTISTSYVKDWGLWEGMRELIQNALDARDEHFGTEMSVRRDLATGDVFVRNEGVTLSRSALLLGSTSKAGRRLRGQYGEGMKLAWLALMRVSGISVHMRTGFESWRPMLGLSSVFGTDVLKVSIQKHILPLNHVEVRVSGISETEWLTIESRLLDIPGLPDTTLKDDEYFRTKISAGKILRAPRLIGKLFSRGLFVSGLPEGFKYGYDLDRITLDRDRKMAESGSLTSNLHYMWYSVVTEGQVPSMDFYSLVSSDAKESREVERYYESWNHHDALTQKVSEAFHTAYGEDTLSVCSEAEKIEADHLGVRSVVVERPIQKMIELQEGDLVKRMHREKLRVREVYSRDELDPRERRNLDWAMKLVKAARPELREEMVQVVKLADDIAYGTFSPVDRSIQLNRPILPDRRQLIATLVHEYAHISGKDGSLEHEREIENIFADIVVNFAGSGPSSDE